MDAATRDAVRLRAGNRCEYCRIPQQATPFIPHHIEHVIAKQHISDDSLENLALACDRCNAFKGPNLGTIIDQETREVVPLFHPRQHDWEEHFRFEGGMIVGLTEIGQATVQLLQMNAPRRIELREEFADQ